MRRMGHLVITADDLGIHAKRDEGILAAFRAGAITQASLMVEGVSAREAARLAKEAGLPLGLHLDLTETPPAAPPSEVRTLLDAGGAKLGKHGLRDAVARGAVDPAHVARETQAQIDRFAELTGARPTHVDGHQHAHIVAELAEVIAPVLLRNGVLTTRIPAQRAVHVDDPSAAAFYRGVSEAGERARLVYAQHGVRSTAAFVGLDLMGFASSREALRAAVREVIDAPSIELMCHPGFVADGGDDFNRSPAREHELATLTALPFAPLIAEGALALATFEALASIGGLA